MPKITNLKIILHWNKLKAFNNDYSRGLYGGEFNVIIKLQNAFIRGLFYEKI